MTKKIFLFLVILVTSLSLEWYEKGNPIFLEGDSIKETLSVKQEIKVVKFFVSWCRHCRTLKKYIDSYKQSQKINKELKFYELNCEVNPYFCTELKVHSFPITIVFG